MSSELENVPLTAEELALARRWAVSQIGRPSTRTDTQPLSRRKATVLIYRLLATINGLEAALRMLVDDVSAEDVGALDIRVWESLGVARHTLDRLAPPSEKGPVGP